MMMANAWMPPGFDVDFKLSGGEGHNKRSLAKKPEAAASGFS